MDVIINLIIALPSVAMLIFMWLWILSKQKSISKYNALLEILDDTDADVAYAWRRYNDAESDYITVQLEYYKLFKSYEALKAELEKANHSIRKRCPHCGMYLTKDGECHNKKCGGKENHVVEAKKAEKPTSDIPESETDPNPILANAEVGDKVRLRIGSVREIIGISDRAYPFRSHAYSWNINGRFFNDGECQLDVVELIKKGDNK